MSNAFAARKPWAAGVLTFFLGPFIGMLYLGRGRMAFIFFLAGAIAALVLFALLPQLIASGLSPDSLWIAQFPVTLAATIFAVILARREDVAAPLPWFSRWYVLLAAFLFTPLLAVGIRMFLYQPFNAVTVSMSPSVVPGDYFLVSKFAYDGRAPQRGDIVAFRVPGKGDYIKRIVGLPGERIQMRGGVLLIDGKAVPSRRVEDFAETDAFGIVRHIAQFDETLPGGRRDRVLDRGPSDFDNTDVFQIPANSYFLLGDNRDNSDDSRGSVGYVARADIIGPVVVKYLSGGHWAWQKID